ncbi:MAG: hypothetical protein VX367_03040 [SAR324 cluster bacterium]|nr:hypothetical protein [SAR324 cluster bacterium]
MDSTTTPRQPRGGGGGREKTTESFVNRLGCFNEAVLHHHHPRLDEALEGAKSTTISDHEEAVDLKKRFLLAVRMNLPQKLAEILQVFTSECPELVQKRDRPIHQMTDR